MNNTINIPGYSSKVNYNDRESANVFTQSNYHYSWGIQVSIHGWYELYTNDCTVVVWRIKQRH